MTEILLAYVYVMSSQIPSESQSLEPISSMKFSADGKFMVAVLAGRVHLLDAFNGNMQHTFFTGSAKGGPALEATFSPDGCYLLSGGGAQNRIASLDPEVTSLRLLMVKEQF